MSSVSALMPERPKQISWRSLVVTLRWTGVKTFKSHQPASWNLCYSVNYLFIVLIDNFQDLQLQKITCHGLYYELHHYICPQFYGASHVHCDITCACVQYECCPGCYVKYCIPYAIIRLEDWWIFVASIIKASIDSWVFSDNFCKIENFGFLKK